MQGNHGEGADLARIKQGIATLFEADQVVEVRTPGKYGWRSGYFDDHERMAVVIKRASDGGAEAVYYTLNPCHEALLARRQPNVLHDDVKESTSDGEITCRRWLFIDFDPKRPKGVSSSKEEKLAARQLMRTVVEALGKEGWPSPVIALSGNGYHVLYRVDEPNDRATTELFKACLRAIAEKFNSDAVEIDQKVFNASRITKAYGSLAAKGANTDERPHRYSKILAVPKPVGVVTREQLEALAETIADAKKSGKKVSVAANMTEKVEEFLRQGGIDAQPPVQSDDGSTKWVLAVCPFNPEHVNDAAVFLQPDGKLGFKCFHASCGDQHWEQFRAVVEKKIGGKFSFAKSGVAGTEPSTLYGETSDGLVWNKVTKDGIVPVQLTNFRARIAADIEQDDGVERSHTFEIEAACGGRKTRFQIEAARFQAMNWPVEKIGAEATVFAGIGTRDHARTAIQLVSGDIPRRRVYVHTGWRRIGGAHFYLHGAGAIGTEGLYDSVNVNLPANLNFFRLPEPPTGERLRKAVRASFRILDVAPRAATIPMYCATFRSVLGAADFSLHATGPTGTFKSSISALMMQHFGRGFDARHLPGSWSSTANANSALQFILKDSLFIIDDFVPRGSHADVERLHRDADRIFRGQGNNAGRARLNRDGMSLRESHPPRGLTLSTGEDVPRGESLASRIWLTEFSSGSVDTEKLTACQADAAAGLYAQAMAGFIQWIAPQYASIKKSLPQQIERFRAVATRKAQHSRTPEIVANLMAGMRYFLRFAQEVGAVTKVDANKIYKGAWKVLLESAAAQARGRSADEPARRFLDLIAAAHLRGDAYFGSCSSDQDTASGEKRGRLIGWTADGMILLDPDSAFTTAHQLAEQQGESLAVGKKTLGKRLQDRGFIAMHDHERNTKQWTVQGTRRRVWCVKTGTIFPPAAES